MGDTRARIIGTGSYLPEKVVSNFDLEKMVDTSNDWIVSRTGIENRRMASATESSSFMASEAAKAALVNAGLNASQIDMILVATVTPDMAFPSTGCLVQEKLGAVNAAAMDVEAGCSGFLYLLTIARGFIEAGLYKNILAIGVETLSRITDYTDRNTCVLFGDGAGACVISASKGEEGILSTHLGADGTGSEYLYMPAGGSLKPATAETILAREHYIKMAGSDVFKFAVRIMGKAALESVDLADLTLEEIDYLVPHQANIRIIEASAKRLKLPMEKVKVNLDKLGNMSAASIPVALDEALRSGEIKKGDNVVLVGFGAGLTWGSAVVKF